jgi:hypothetical protein
MGRAQSEPRNALRVDGAEERGECNSSATGFDNRVYFTTNWIYSCGCAFTRSYAAKSKTNADPMAALTNSAFLLLYMIV